MDNAAMAKYAEKLPDYDLFPEWISNWGYGNVQKNRNRMFMLGALRKEKWDFGPSNELMSIATKSGDVIRDCPRNPVRHGNMPNHDPHDQRRK